ncbi:MAG: SDR family NAD(P)-dependent oxidoreductase, partial [Burkholderiales bacterium]|nr:SDR family NAD(P)-dependent oxidoreductase [Anaerolineae bacterium]
MRAAFISGAGEGIGAAIAHHLAEQGIAVAVNDVVEARAAAVADEIQAKGGQAIALGGDVADVEQVRAMIAQTVVQFGRLDIAIANAGITSWGDFFDYEQASFDRVVGVNLRGSYFTAQAAARQMREQGTGGRIIFTSSVTGHQAIRYL